ncbi:MAG TPA: DMT family transporter [Candidatus Babeliales bacterium]|nr:DMT family transporter [Candidatus Babeliales bacterium]
MNNSLAIAVFAGLGGMLGWGLADFFAKKTIDKIGDLPSLVWAHLFGTSLFVLLALLNWTVLGNTVHIPTKLHVWAGLIFFGALQMVVYWLVYKGFSKGQLAVLNPVFASYSGIVALISVVFLAEALTGITALALLIIFAGIILMNTDLEGLGRQKLKIVPGLKEVGAAALLAAAWTLLWDKFISGQDFLTYALFMYLFMTMAAVIAAKSQKTKLLPIDNSLWKLLFFIGLGETVAYLAISWGFSRTGYTSVVALLSGCFSVPTVILAHIYLKERITRLQEASVVMIVAGIILLSAF